MEQAIEHTPTRPLNKRIGALTNMADILIQGESTRSMHKPELGYFDGENGTIDHLIDSATQLRVTLNTSMGGYGGRFGANSRITVSSYHQPPVTIQSSFEHPSSHAHSVLLDTASVDNREECDRIVTYIEQVMELFTVDIAQLHRRFARRRTLGGRSIQDVSLVGAARELEVSEAEYFIHGE